MLAEKEHIDITKDIDEEGFLVQPERWDEQVAQLLARTEVPQGLTANHWKIIDYLRNYFREFGTVPPPRMISRFTGFNLQQICELFPSGLTRGACRIAGIPKATIRPSFLYP